MDIIFLLSMFFSAGYIGSDTGEDLIGFGAFAGSLHSQHPSIDSTSYTGINFLFEKKFREWAIDVSASSTTPFSTSATPEIYYPSDSAYFWGLSINFKRYLNGNTSTYQYWFGAGPSFMFTTWNTYYYDLAGTGYNLALGIDSNVSTNVLMRLALTHYNANMTSTYGYGPTSNSATDIGITFMYRF